MQIAVDKEYLVRTIDHLEREKKEHNKKFAGNPKHEHCLPRFDTAINQLTLELDKLELSKLVK